MDGMGWVGWDLCAGLFYEHRFAMLINKYINTVWVKFEDRPSMCIFVYDGGCIL